MERFGWTRQEFQMVASRGWDLAQQGRFKEAAVIFEGLAAINPEDNYCRNALGALYLALRQPHLALKHLNQALMRDPRDAEALGRRVEALLDAGNVARAREDFDELRRVAGPETVARLELRLQAGSSGRAISAQLPSPRIR